MLNNLLKYKLKYKFFKTNKCRLDSSACCFNFFDRLISCSTHILDNDKVFAAFITDCYYLSQFCS